MDRNQKKDFWHNHIEECSKSNLSQIDYCTTHKIPLSTFSYWKKKLKSDNSSKPVFYPIALSSEQSSSQEQKATSLILHIRDGRFTLEIEKDFLPSTLSQVVTTLEQL